MVKFYTSPNLKKKKKKNKGKQENEHQPQKTGKPTKTTKIVDTIETEKKGREYRAEEKKKTFKVNNKKL